MSILAVKFHEVLLPRRAARRRSPEHRGRAGRQGASPPGPHGRRGLGGSGGGTAARRAEGQRGRSGARAAGGVPGDVAAGAHGLGGAGNASSRAYRAPEPAFGARPGGQRSDGQSRQGGHAAAAGRRAARAPLWCRGPVSGGAARGRRSPPAPQVCEPELSADVLRRIESGTAPLVLHADVRGSGQISRLLSAAPGGRPSWYRQPVGSRRSRRRNMVSGSRRQRRLDEGLACAFVRGPSRWAPTVWACPSGSAVATQLLLAPRLGGQDAVARSDRRPRGRRVAPPGLEPGLPNPERQRRYAGATHKTNTNREIVSSVC